MAWDSNRDVPWSRMFREWIVYATVMVLVFVVFLRNSVTGGSIVGLAASFPMYLVFGWVLAKFGYQRKTLRDLRQVSHAKESRSPTPAPHRPPPTRRTSTGPSQHRPKNGRRRR